MSNFTQPYLYHVGIAVSKLTLDVCEINGAQIRQAQFGNTRTGWKKLCRWLGKKNIAQTHIAMEATGGYQDGVAEWLYQAGYAVSVVNPFRIYNYGKSLLRRTKTDRSDAALIAQFCQQQKPRLWQPLSQAQKGLQALTRQLEHFIAQRAAEKNRLQSIADTQVKNIIKHFIRTLDKEIKRLEKQICNYIKTYDELHQQYSLLQSIVGIGQRTATLILANMPRLAEYDNAKQAAADAGLTPAERSSGTSVKGRSPISKVGNARLRKTLFMPALSAMRFTPLLRAFAERLRCKGKPEKVIVVAVMHKLLRIAYGVLKKQLPFDPNYI